MINHHSGIMLLFIIYLCQLGCVPLVRADAGMADVISQVQKGTFLRKVPRDKLPAILRSDTVFKERNVSVAETEKQEGARTRVTTTTETFTKRRKTKTVHFELDDEVYEFSGQIWPKGKYSVYVDIKDFEMSKNERILTRNAKPEEIDTKDDGKFTAKFHAGRTPRNVYIHIFGGKEEPHIDLHIPDIEWDKVYFFDLNKTEVYAVRPRAVAGELEKLGERDKKPEPKKEEKKANEKTFSGLVWPNGEKYTLFASIRDFDLDGKGEPVKKRKFHPDPVKANFDDKGQFEAKMTLDEKPESLFVWVKNEKGARKRFTIPSPDIDGTRYALDMRASPPGKTVETFNKMPDILKKLKADGMQNTEQIPYATGGSKKAEPEKKKEAPANGDLLKSIQAMIDELGEKLSKKIEQQHESLKKALGEDIEERVGKKLASLGKRFESVEGAVNKLYKNLPRDIEEVVINEFDALYKKKMIGKFN